MYDLVGSVQVHVWSIYFEIESVYSALCCILNTQHVCVLRAVSWCSADVVAALGVRGLHPTDHC